MDPKSSIPDTALLKQDLTLEPESERSQHDTISSSTAITLTDEGENAKSEAPQAPQAQKKSEQTLTDWDGPDDPGDPRNWSYGLRVYGVFVPALYAFAVYV